MVSVVVYRKLSLLQICLQSQSELVRAGGRFRTAGDALNSRDDILCLLSLNQRSDALEVAVASADKLYRLDGISVHLQNNIAGAGAFGMYSNFM